MLLQIQGPNGLPRAGDYHIKIVTVFLSDLGKKKVEVGLACD